MNGSTQFAFFRISSFKHFMHIHPRPLVCLVCVCVCGTTKNMQIWPNIRFYRFDYVYVWWKGIDRDFSAIGHPEKCLPSTMNCAVDTDVYSCIQLEREYNGFFMHTYHRCSYARISHAHWLWSTFDLLGKGNRRIMKWSEKWWEENERVGVG